MSSDSDDKEYSDSDDKEYSDSDLLDLALIGNIKWIKNYIRREGLSSENNAEGAYYVAKVNGQEKVAEFLKYHDDGNGDTNGNCGHNKKEYNKKEGYECKCKERREAINDDYTIEDLKEHACLYDTLNWALAKKQYNLIKTLADDKIVGPENYSIALSLFYNVITETEINDIISNNCDGDNNNTELYNLFTYIVKQQMPTSELFHIACFGNLNLLLFCVETCGITGAKANELKDVQLLSIGIRNGNTKVIDYLINSAENPIEFKKEMLRQAQIYDKRDTGVKRLIEYYGE
jgi:hypothetical protein